MIVCIRIHIFAHINERWHFKTKLTMAAFFQFFSSWTPDFFSFLMTLIHFNANNMLISWNDIFCSFSLYSRFLIFCAFSSYFISIFFGCFFSFRKRFCAYPSRKRKRVSVCWRGFSLLQLKEMPISSNPIWLLPFGFPWTGCHSKNRTP